MFKSLVLEFKMNADSLYTTCP